jgi:hypothetical protein
MVILFFYVAVLGLEFEDSSKKTISLPSPRCEMFVRRLDGWDVRRLGRQETI